MSKMDLAPFVLKKMRSDILSSNNFVFLISNFKLENVAQVTFSCVYKMKL